MQQTNTVGRRADALEASRAYVERVRQVAAGAVVRDGRVDSAAADDAQRALHGFAWVATTVEAMAAVVEWADRADAGDVERRVADIVMGEYLAQLIGGVPMSQNEIVRPADLGSMGGRVAH